jgi:uncharacterized protein YifN (PemK superfamily)
MVLTADFSIGFRAPEINKRRPVVVLSERSRNRDTTIVVPTSTRLPTSEKAIFVELSLEKYPFFEKQSYAKCAVVNSVRLGRLFTLRDKASGRWTNSHETMIDADDLKKIRAGVARAIGPS